MPSDAKAAKVLEACMYHVVLRNLVVSSSQSSHKIHHHHTNHQRQYYNMIVSSALRETALQAPSTALQYSSLLEADANNGGVGGFATSLVSTIKNSAPQSVDQFQEWGENAFAAMFLIAFVQALVALFQYRNNPKGSLLVPPGNTEGLVSPGAKCEECKVDEESWFYALKDLESTFHEVRETGMTSIMPSEKGESSAVVKRISKALVLMVPWASNVFSFIIQRNIHLFHLGFFLSLSQLLDFPDRLFSSEGKVEADSSFDESTAKTDRPLNRVIVLGDSLAAGVGTVDVFEEELEGRQPDRKGPGPVFPRALAQRISENSGEPVHWRSAGIVGGDAKDIEENCLDVVREEVKNGRSPDLVMIICGINDLKRFATNPLKNAGPKEFRARMTKLVNEIRELSPGTRVALPSMPTQMFRKDSPMNIFPLVFFLNTVVGLWDSQKKLVANKFPLGEVSYLGLDPDEVYDWYMSDPSKYGVPSDLDGDGMMDTTLIARDGVHPNAKCYAFWGASLANKLSRTRKGDDASTTEKVPVSV
jgi:lysophospholipase L1-like esterase